MNTTSSGNCHLASLGAKNARISSLVTVSPSLGTTHASGRSDHFGCGTPTTAASFTLGCDMSSFSISTDEIHSPPDLMRSFVRSTNRMRPAESTTATSPVRNQPSLVKLSAERGSL